MSDNVRPGLLRKKWFWVSLIVVIGAVATAVVILPRTTEDKKPEAAAPEAKAPLGIGCRGWIEPEDGVLKVAVPVIANTTIIASLDVKEGDYVKAGQILAVLAGRVDLENSLKEAEAEIKVSQMKLAQIQAGTKAADIDAQKAEVARWESEFEFATSEYQRYQRLRQTENATAADLEQKRIAVDRARNSVDNQREKLKAMEDIRKEDVNLAQAELDKSAAKAETVRGQLERTLVRAPASGTVVRIHAHPGEEVGSDGLLELAKTDRMYVVAEVYETDINRVVLGQKAKISGELLPHNLEGVVDRIGKEIARSQLMPTDTASFADTRIIKVNIKLQDPKLVAGLINGKVSVAIEP